jgi:hypothetical protein
MSYTVLKNTTSKLDNLYRRLGKEYILNKHYLIGKGVDMYSVSSLMRYERLLNVDECLLDFEHENILEFINKQIHVKL